MIEEKVVAGSADVYCVRVNESAGLMMVDAIAAKTCITINLTSGGITVETSGDISIHSGGKLSLKGDQGVAIESGGDMRMVASEESIIRGKMVRIN